MSLPMHGVSLYIIVHVVSLIDVIYVIVLSNNNILTTANLSR